MPEIYLDIAYNFAIGTLWLKFNATVLPAHECMQQLFNLYPGEYVKRHIDFIENIGFMCQIAPDNASLISQLLTSFNMRSLSEEIISDDI